MNIQDQHLQENMDAALTGTESAGPALSQPENKELNSWWLKLGGRGGQRSRLIKTGVWDEAEPLLAAGDTSSQHNWILWGQLVQNRTRAPSLQRGYPTAESFTDFSLESSSTHTLTVNTSTMGDFHSSHRVPPTHLSCETEALKSWSSAWRSFQTCSKTKQDFQDYFPVCTLSRKCCLWTRNLSCDANWSEAASN